MWIQIIYFINHEEYYIVAGFLVGHSHADDLPAMFRALAESNALSPAVRTGITDRRIMIHHILLHDASQRPAGGLPW